jgi:hypothetical protein
MQNQDSPCPGRDSNRAPAGYKLEEDSETKLLSHLMRDVCYFHVNSNALLSIGNVRDSNFGQF